MAVMFYVLINLLLFIFMFGFCYGGDSFNSSQSVSDGKTLVSSDGHFELGFFSPGKSGNHYLGIWYQKISVQTVVWVANRINPINDSSGVLLINRNGNLILLSQSNSVVWSTNSTRTSRNPIVQLLDSGNLVIKDGNSETLLWQSFDYPTDTMLPGMKIGWDRRTGLTRHLSAWKNTDDPSPGHFTCGIELYNYPDFFSWKGMKKYSRSGPWNGLGFSGIPVLRPTPGYQYEFVWNEDEVYFIFNLENESAIPITRYFLNQAIYQWQGYFWNEAAETWVFLSYTPKDVCDNYGMCGAYGSCDSAELIPCRCLKGFKPKASQQESINWYEGCVRKTPLDCRTGDGFIKYDGLKLPDTEQTWVDRSIGLKECRDICLHNCSCMAYTNTDIRTGSGCVIWFGDLIDIKQFQTGGQELYIRMSSSEAEPEGEHKGENKMKIAAIITPTVVFIVVALLFGRYYIFRSFSKDDGDKENVDVNEMNDAGQNEDIELELFDLNMLAKATDDFSFNNKLGEGGFGSVYKGILEDGKQIAVKRLSIGSRQGSNEFKNEVAVIAKLQHRNLVKLLGCCIQRDEKMLVYEFMPNKSLNFFIFDRTRCELLDWPKRFHIINGVARGLVYLHRDSRLRIIHRDLKTSNVLLDSEMNPRISDFGLAKTFGGDQTEGSTNRVVGTYGYMAPEYAINGQFSVKSDVFSFGILMLEIISGKKNKGFYHPSYVNLIGHAWGLWKQGKPLELIDSILRESCCLREVVRCINIALLCLQEHPTDRPSISSVVLMLGSETALVEPKEPCFIINKSSSKIAYYSRKSKTSSNDVSISMVEGR